MLLTHLADMGTAALPGRNVLDIEVVRSLSHRSNARRLTAFGAPGCADRHQRSGVVIPGQLVSVDSGDGPAGVCDRYHVAPMTRVRALHGVQVAAAQRLFWLAGRHSLLLQLDVFSSLSHLAPSLYTRPRARSRAGDTQAATADRLCGVHLSGVPFWLTKPRELAAIAAGRLSHLPYIPADARRTVALSAAAQVAVYVIAIVGSVAVRNTFLLYYWLLPALFRATAIAGDFNRRAYRLQSGYERVDEYAHHLDEWPVRLLMWNMPFHAEHHLYPSIPFYQLPHAHQHLAKKLTHLAPSYVAANQSVVRSLRTAPPRDDLSRAWFPPHNDSGLRRRWKSSTYPIFRCRWDRGSRSRV